MNGFQSLVVGVDGSKASIGAVRWAAEHLAPDGLLQVVHARSDPTVNQLKPAWVAPAHEFERRVESSVIDDEPTQALLGVAEPVDAIVVGAHGSGNSRHVLGRVTTKLLHRSDVPVVVINPNRVDTGPASGTVVACVGYGRASDQAADWAADHASSRGLPLMLLHVVGPRPLFPADSPGDTIASYFGPELVRDWAQSDLDGLQQELQERWPALSITTQLELGLKVASIEDASVGAELVVLGKRQYNRLTKAIIGHRLHQLVVRITAPVAVVPCATDE